MSNFIHSLNRNRREFSEARANMLAIDASESRHDILREVNKEIRLLENKLVAIENDAYEDDIIVAFKKGRSIDVRKDLVEARYDTLLDLRDLYIRREVIVKDVYFDMPEELVVHKKGKYEDMLTDSDLAATGNHPAMDNPTEPTEGE